MKILALIAILLSTNLALAQTLPSEPPITPTEKVELFNGKDLTGWVSYLRNNAPAESVWSVKDGNIICVGKPTGYLRTEKSYANYQVTVEWRFTKAGNTGVLVHMHDPAKVWPLCVECQGYHAQQGDMYLWSGAKARELSPATKQKRAEMIPRTAPDAEKPLGEWNTYQVICSDDTVTIVVNGQTMNKATQCSITSGFIGLQSEGAGLEIRRVTLEPLAGK
jgi:hypothetical protein